MDFIVRARTPAEDVQFRGIERIIARSGRNRGGRYFDALLAWLEEHAAAAPGDPFLALMLNQGMQIAMATGGAPAEGLRRIAELRERTLTTQGHTLAGAVIMEAIASHTPEQLASVTRRLPPGCAKDIGAHQVRLLDGRRGAASTTA